MVIDPAVFPRLIKRTDTHLYLLPHPRLRAMVAHYTVSFPGTGPVPDTLTLIPDASGCIVSDWAPDGVHSRLWGPTTKTVVVANDVNRMPMRLFVEFKPCGAYRLLHMPQSLLTDRILPLGQWSPGVDRRLEQLLLSCPVLSQLAEGLDGLLLHLLDARSLTGAEQAVLPLLCAGQTSVARLAQQAHYSQRQLSRLFLDCMGMGAKTYLRLCRINQILQQLPRSGLSLTRLAADAGYYDQSHFIRDFKSVCGLSPGAYLKRLSEFYNETYKF